MSQVIDDDAAAPPESLSKRQAGDARAVAKGGAIQIGGQIANRALTFLFLAVAVRTLGTDGFGLYKQVFQVLTIGTMLASGGFPWAAVRFITQARTRGDHSGSRGAGRVTLVSTAVISAVFFALVVAFPSQFAGPFADSVSDRSEFALLLQIGAAYIPFYAVMQVLRSCTQAYKTMVPAVMVGNIIQPISRLGLGIIALLLGWALTGAMTTLVISGAMGMIAGLWYYRRMLTADELAAKPRANVKEILKFTLPQAGVTFFGTGSLGLGVLILGAYGSDAQVGLFAIATALQTAGNIFATGIVAIFSPLVVELYERTETARLEALYQTINRWMATFSLPIFGALMLEPDLFTRILGGNEAAGAAILIPILAIGNIVRVGTGPASTLLSMSGRPLLNFFNSFFAVVAYVGLGIWLVPTYGALGMAIVDSGVTLLVNAARALEVRILLGLRPFGKTFLKPIVAISAAAVVALTLRLFVAEAVVFELAGLVVFMVVYLAALKMLGIDPEERHVYDAFKDRMLKRLGRKKASR
ncbi:MAG: oligosaccharide flippase family protein [Actinomycetota bacterium]